MLLDDFSSLGANSPSGCPPLTLSWFISFLFVIFCDFFFFLSLLLLSCALWGYMTLSYREVLKSILLICNFIPLSSSPAHRWHNYGICTFHWSLFCLFVTTKNPDWKYLSLLHLKMKFLWYSFLYLGQPNTKNTNKGRALMGLRPHVCSLPFILRSLYLVQYPLHFYSHLERTTLALYFFSIFVF